MYHGVFFFLQADSRPGRSILLTEGTTKLKYVVRTYMRTCMLGTHVYADVCHLGDEATDDKDNRALPPLRVPGYTCATVPPPATWSIATYAPATSSITGFVVACMHQQRKRVCATPRS